MDFLAGADGWPDGVNDGESTLKVFLVLAGCQTRGGDGMCGGGTGMSRAINLQVCLGG